MKKRLGFVSNSSSSSFIVIGNSNKLDEISGELYRVGENGHTEFGWDIDDIRDIDSRINFCYLQILSTGNKVWKEMLEQVIKENSEVKTIDYLLKDDWEGECCGYIDHQSGAGEGENTEMFDNKEKLKQFIFDSASYIHTDNDNH